VTTMYLAQEGQPAPVRPDVEEADVGRSLQLAVLVLLFLGHLAGDVGHHLLVAVGRPALGVATLQVSSHAMQS